MFRLSLLSNWTHRFGFPYTPSNFVIYAFVLSLCSLLTVVLPVNGQPVDTSDAFTDVSEGRITGQRPLRALAFKSANKTAVNVVLMTPMNLSYSYSFPKVMPALEIALREVELTPSLLPNHYLHLRYFDSRCNEADPMNYAINAYIDKVADLFLGPVCDYSVAPVTRQATFWDKPVVTVGANAPDFMDEKQVLYPMLTRVGPVNFLRISEFIVEQMHHYEWRKIALVYERKSTSETFHYFQAQALYYGIRRHGLFSEVSNMKDHPDYEHLLKKMLGTELSAIAARTSAGTRPVAGSSPATSALV
ncbi:Atrial natriuretic peptide receptor 3 [Plakobranchus ocellatus]|uniref:Atrial natriuretic peptide receptor 3 n=1 Tax=Plakobranchus ocellatus TaxID=259542 RepID=A0AAV4DFX8_9GAST|nr:Atrial natriuretic peptide receptor 3 [Plakobranchus ocellatus]